MNTPVSIISKVRKPKIATVLLDFLSKWGTVLTIVFLLVFFSFKMPTFMSSANMVTILRSISIVTVIAHWHHDFVDCERLRPFCGVGGYIC
jgi:predicted ABC-type sugar transport system permease subunit